MHVYPTFLFFDFRQDYSLTTNGIDHITVKTVTAAGGTSTTSSRVDILSFGKMTSMCVFDDGLQRQEKSLVCFLYK